LKTVKQEILKIFIFFKINHKKNSYLSSPHNFPPVKLFICPTTGYYSKASGGSNIYRLFDMAN
jgi:hypothetical protein